MIDKVWIVKREEEGDSYDSILDDKFYLSEEKAKIVAESHNKGSIYRYYVDYLEIDE